MKYQCNKRNKDFQFESTLDRIKEEHNCLLREQFIYDYIPFITRVVSNVLHKYIDVKSSDEFCIGLSAFNEAIDSFDKTKQRIFLNFSEQVIRRRVIDYIKKDMKNNNVYPFTYFYNEYCNNFEDMYVREDTFNYFENVENRHEIALFKQELSRFGINIEELDLCSPKHRDSKQLCIKIAKKLCSHDRLFSELCRSKRMPIRDLMKIVNVSKRTIERNRKFIIAVCLILKSNLTILQSYVQTTGEEERGM